MFPLNVDFVSLTIIIIIIIVLKIRQEKPYYVPNPELDSLVSSLSHQL